MPDDLCRPARRELGQTQFPLGAICTGIRIMTNISGHDRYFLNFMSAGLNVVIMSCIIPLLVT